MLVCWGIFRFSRSEPGEVVTQGGSSSTSLVGALTPAAEQFSGLGSFFFLLSITAMYFCQPWKLFHLWFSLSNIRIDGRRKRCRCFHSCMCIAQYVVVAAIYGEQWFFIVCLWCDSMQ